MRARYRSTSGERGLSFKEAINDLIRTGALEPAARKPFHTATSSLGAAVGSGGNLVNDAHVAALSIEHRCGIVSFNTDFGRFPGIRWQPPPA